MRSFLEWLEAFNSTRTATVTTPTGEQVQFVADRPGLTLVVIDPDKFIPYYKMSLGYMVRGNSEEIEGRLDRFDNWMKTRAVPIEAPVVSFSSNAASRKRYAKGAVPDEHHMIIHQVNFSDGRHRFGWMVEQGWRQIAIAVPTREAAYFQSMFGI